MGPNTQESPAIIAAREGDLQDPIAIPTYSNSVVSCWRCFCTCSVFVMLCLTMWNPVERCGMMVRRCKHCLWKRCWMHATTTDAAASTGLQARPVCEKVWSLCHYVSFHMSSNLSCLFQKGLWLNFSGPVTHWTQRQRAFGHVPVPLRPGYPDDQCTVSSGMCWNMLNKRETWHLCVSAMARTWNQRTAMHYAARNGRQEAIQCLKLCVLCMLLMALKDQRWIHSPCQTPRAIIYMFQFLVTLRLMVCQGCDF